MPTRRQRRVLLDSCEGAVLGVVFGPYYRLGVDRRRAVDRDGRTIDFLLRAHRDYVAARCFFERAIELHGVPERITIDKSAANTTAIESIPADSGADIELRQSKYLNNIVEQDHRAIKRIARPMMGFKSFHCARVILAGIETMHMIKKGQLNCPKVRTLSAASQFHSLAF